MGCKKQSHHFGTLRDFATPQVDHYCGTILHTNDIFLPQALEQHIINCKNMIRLALVIYQTEHFEKAILP